MPNRNFDTDGTPTLDEHDNQVYEKKTVKGANIIDNVYGGGNKADVTGSTHVEVGKQPATGGG